MKSQSRKETKREREISVLKSIVLHFTFYGLHFKFWHKQEDKKNMQTQSQ